MSAPVSVPGYITEDWRAARRRTALHARVRPTPPQNLERDDPRPMEGFAFVLAAAAFMGLVVGVVIGLMFGRTW